MRARLALHACPGQGSCGGMFTYNTMQTFIGVLGMEPLHMVAPASDDARRTKTFPDELAALLATITAAGIRPRDIVTPASMRNAFVVVMAMGGSTNVVLHGPEIARAAGFDLWDDVMSQQEFNELSHRLPVLVNMRPFGGVLDGRRRRDRRRRRRSSRSCSPPASSTDRRSPAPARRWPSRSSGSTRRRPTARSCYPVRAPFKPTGGLRLLRGNLAPDGGAILKVAGVEGGIVDGRFTGRARVFEGEPSLIAALEDAPDSFADGDIVDRPLRGSARRARHARDARPDVAHHRAVPCDGASRSRS